MRLGSLRIGFRPGQAPAGTILANYGIFGESGAAVIASKAKQSRSNALMLLWIATAAEAASR